MFKSEEHKLDKLEQELLDIEKVAKNLDLNSKDEDRMVLTNIVSEIENIPKEIIPDTESLKDTYERVLKYFHDEIEKILLNIKK